MPSDYLGNDADTIRSRLLARLTRGEFFALSLALGILGVFVWYQSVFSITPYDLSNYLNAARGDMQHYYYAYWFIPVFQVIDWFPNPLNYILWNAVNIACIFFAARVFGGKAPLALLSYQLFYSLFQGQIVGVIIGGIGLCYWGIVSRRWMLAGLGLTIALTKFQLGLVPALCFLYFSQTSWRENVRILVVPVVTGLVSMILYPAWPLQWLMTLQVTPPNDEGSISAWRWLGPFALVLWLPPLVLKLSRAKRVYLLLSANALALPYFQQTDLLLLFVMPFGWLAALGNIGYLFTISSWQALQALVVVPMLLYGILLVQGFREKRNAQVQHPL